MLQTNPKYHWESTGAQQLAPRSEFDYIKKHRHAKLVYCFGQPEYVDTTSTAHDDHTECIKLTWFWLDLILLPSEAAPRIFQTPAEHRLDTTPALYNLHKYNPDPNYISIVYHFIN